jgi:hypothetical protein
MQPHPTPPSTRIALPAEAPSSDDTVIQYVQYLTDLGYTVVPTKPGKPKQLDSRTKGKQQYSEQDFLDGKGIALRTGLLLNGLYLCRLDLDSHKEDQDADVAYETIAGAVGPLLDHCAVKRSTNGAGIDILFLSTTALPNNQPIYLDEHHIGEVFCQGGHVSLTSGWISGSIETMQPLTEDELQKLSEIVTIQRGSRNPTSWTARAREVLPFIRNWEQVPTARLGCDDGMPKTFCGDERKHRIGQDNWRKLKQARKGERSNYYALYVQSLMMLASSAYGSSAAEKCRTVAALAIADCPKTGEKGYNAERDAAALIGRMLHSDGYSNGRGTFKCPWWASSYQPIAERPRGRPKGDHNDYNVPQNSDTKSC